VFELDVRSWHHKQPGYSIMNRRQFNGLLAASVLTVADGHRASAAPASAVVRIGYQNSSTLIGVLKAQGSIDRALTPLGLTASWAEFPNGLPLLEALNVGAINFSADVADTVPLFAQAAGANLTYVARGPGNPGPRSLAYQGSHRLEGQEGCRHQRRRQPFSTARRAPQSGPHL
jgi:sulfonate transport system substrate-binding protein